MDNAEYERITREIHAEACRLLACKPKVYSRSGWRRLNIPGPQHEIPLSIPAVRGAAARLRAEGWGDI